MRIVQLPPSRSVPAHRFYAQARSRRRISMYVCLPAPFLGLSGARKYRRPRKRRMARNSYLGYF